MVCPTKATWSPWNNSKHLDTTLVIHVPIAFVNRQMTGHKTTHVVLHQSWCDKRGQVTYGWQRMMLGLGKKKKKSDKNAESSQHESLLMPPEEYKKHWISWAILKDTANFCLPSISVCQSKWYNKDNASPVINQCWTNFLVEAAKLCVFQIYFWM